MDFFGLWKKGQGIFLGMLKKVAIFFGQTNFEVVIFLGIKYEPLSDPPPPPVIKICEWGPWGPANPNYKLKASINTKNSICFQACQLIESALISDVCSFKRMTKN